MKDNAEPFYRMYIFTHVDPLKKRMATHSSILAWRIPWTGVWWATVHGFTKSQT